MSATGIRTVRNRNRWQLKNREWSVTQVTYQRPSQWYLVTSWFRRCPSWRLKMPGHWLQSHLWDYRSHPLSFSSNSLSFLSSVELRYFSFPGHDQGHWVSALEIPLGAQILAGSGWHRQHKVAFSCLSLSQHWTNQCSGTKQNHTDAYSNKSNCYLPCS